MSAAYVPVRVSTFRGDKKITFNTYVRVAGRYILFCREGDSFEGARLERLKTKKLQKMFILEEHLSAYNTYIHENIDRAYDSSTKKPLDVRAQIIHGALQAATEDLIEDPSSKAFYAVALDGTKRFAKFLYSEPQSLKSILEIKNTDFNIAHHGVVVASLALAIAEEMNFTETNPMQIETMAVGCLLHDIENHYNNLDVSTDPNALGKTEKQIYARHASEGAERLRQTGVYDPTVIDIVEKHDEKIDGSGPLKIKEDQVTPLVWVARTANMFDRLLLYESLSPKDALKKLLIDEMGVSSLSSMKALQAALKKHGVLA